MTRKILAVLILLTVLASCASRDKLRYYKGIEQVVENDSISYNTVLKQDDLLSIVVFAPNAEATVNFNVASYGQATAGVVAGVSPVQSQTQTYLIDNEGFIEFPVLGKLKLAGLKRKEALGMIKSKLKAYIKDPSVTLRILNYKIAVQGEVNRPGIFPITTERISLPEALAMAGDLTIYGKRDNILIIREIDGKKTYNFIDISKADFVTSPFYYLTQNDMVYVEPNKIRMNTSALSPNISLILASVTTLLSVYVIFIKK